METIVKSQKRLRGRTKQGPMGCFDQHWIVAFELGMIVKSLEI